jgi:hypothetical protein
MIEGYVHEVKDGILYGTIIVDLDESFEFEMPFLSVPECQRQYIEPGTCFKLINGGYMLVSKLLWTTHELEEADREAAEWAKVFETT